MTQPRSRPRMEETCDDTFGNGYEVSPVNPSCKRLPWRQARISKYSTANPQQQILTSKYSTANPHQQILTSKSSTANLHQQKCSPAEQPTPPRSPLSANIRQEATRLIVHIINTSLRRRTHARVRAELGHLRVLKKPLLACPKSHSLAM